MQKISQYLFRIPVPEKPQTQSVDLLADRKNPYQERMGVLFEYLIWSQARFGCPKNVNDSVSTEFNGKRSPSNNLWNKDRLFGNCRNTHTCVGNCIYSVVLNSRAQIKCFQRFDLFDVSLFGSGAETSRGVGWVVWGRGLLLPTWTCRNGSWGWPGNLWRAAIFVSLFNLFFCPTLSFCVFQLATKLAGYSGTKLAWKEDDDLPLFSGPSGPQNSQYLLGSIVPPP